LATDRDCKVGDALEIAEQTEVCAKIGDGDPPRRFRPKAAGQQKIILPPFPHDSRARVGRKTGALIPRLATQFNTAVPSISTESACEREAARVYRLGCECDVDKCSYRSASTVIKIRSETA
jgi:hypothetical protein